MLDPILAEYILQIFRTAIVATIWILGALPSRQSFALEDEEIIEYQELQGECSVGSTSEHGSQDGSLQNHSLGLRSRADCRQACAQQMQSALDLGLSKKDVICTFLGVDESGEFLAGFDFKVSNTVVASEEDSREPSSQGSSASRSTDSSLPTDSSQSPPKAGYQAEERVAYLESKLDMAEGLTLDPALSNEFREEAESLRQSPSDDQAWEHNLKVLSLESRIARAAGGGVDETHRFLTTLLRTRELEGMKTHEPLIVESRLKLSYLKSLRDTFESTGGIDEAERSHLLQELDSLGNKLNR